MHNPSLPSSHSCQGGMSLISVLVAIGVGGIAALGMMKMFKQGQDANTLLAGSTSRTAIGQLVLTIIGNEKSCLATFKAKSFNPDKTAKQNIQLQNAAGTVVLGSNDTKHTFKGLEVESVTAQSNKTDDNEYQVTIEVTTARFGNFDTAQGPKNQKRAVHDSGKKESFLVNIATDTKGDIVGCGNADEPFKVANLIDGKIKMPGGKSALALHHAQLNPKYSPSVYTWLNRIDYTKTCIDENSGTPNGNRCAEDTFTNSIVDIKAKGHVMDISLSALLGAVGPGQTAQFDAFLLHGAKCLKKVRVHSVQTGGGLRDMQTSNGSGRMIVEGLKPGERYRLRFKFLAPRYRSLLHMVGTPLNPKKAHASCGGFPSTDGTPGFYCPIWATFWGGTYSIIEYKAPSSKPNWENCDFNKQF